MKKKYLSVALVLTLAMSTVCSSCIGSFTLTNKLLSWNNTIDSKTVNALIFAALWIVPVYEVSAIADVLVLNSIEFWSGENPVASTKKVVEGRDGRYLVESDSNGYTITGEDGSEVVRLDFDRDSQTWSLVNGEATYPLMTFVDDTHVKMITPDGGMVTVETTQAGAWAYQQIVSGSLMAQH